MNLKEIRKSQSLTLKALSELSGVPQRTIEDI
ncbi:helix-turn-helix domain-containing protein, partial [Clostridium butyricum]